MAAGGVDTKYDFYIRSEDAEWEKQMLQELQRINPEIKCLSSKDKKPGKYKLQNLTEPVERCKKVVVGFTSKPSTGNQEFVAVTAVQQMIDRNTLNQGNFIPVKITKDAEIPKCLNAFTACNFFEEEEEFYNFLFNALHVTANHPEIPDRVSVPGTKDSNSKMSSGILQRMNDSGYKNWIRLGQALILLNECLQPIAEQGITDFHETLKSKHPGECKSDCKPKEKPPETCNVCTKWMESIYEQHSNFERIEWSNVDPKLWPTDKWEVAKMYMARGQKPGKYDPDISSVLNLMNLCKIFHPSKKTKMKIKPENFTAILNVRNKLMHSKDLKVEEDYLNSSFDKIFTIFNKLPTDGDNVKRNKQLFKELKTLKYEVNAEGKLSSFSEQVDVNKLEIKLINQKLSALTKDVESNKEKLDGLKDLKDFLNKHQDLKREFEDKITEIKKEISENKEEIAENKKEIAKIKEKIAENKQESAENKEKIAENKEKIAENKQQSAENKEKIAENKEKIAEIK